LSIHVNCSLGRPSADGSIVFYNDRSELSKALAYCIQRKLNDVPVNGVKRTVHNPVRGNYFLLGYTQIPGVIVKTAFISNSAERQELSKDAFKEAIAEAVDIAVEQYLNEQNGSF
jgi:N-acetylmuramoyl-L-alanine amidase